jgi:hypothetical protein
LSYWKGLLGTALLLPVLFADNMWKVRQRVTDEGGLVEREEFFFSKQEWEWNPHS